MFYALRNLFALLGLAAVIAVIILSVKISPMKDRLDQFDEKALDVYTDMITKVLETGNAAEATVWKVKVAEGLEVEDVEQSMRFVANEHNIKNVGELPLSEQVTAMTGETSRYFKIFMFCNALTAAQMLDYSDAYAAYLPCRVSLVEDKEGNYWIYSLNMDAMIHGGTPLPPDLKEEAENVKMIIQDIMNRGAEGDF